MTEIALLLVALVVGFVAGWRLREVHAKMVVDKFVSNMEKNVHDGIKEGDIMNVEVVPMNEQFYIYNAENNSFIVQVKTKDELFEYFKDKYPNKTVMMKKEHFAMFDTVS